MMEGLVARLLALQNADGGWGTTGSRPSNTEATALCALALDGISPGGVRALAWLVAHQRSDGGWPWTEEMDAPSWASVHGVLALAAAGQDPAAVERGVAWLLGVEGRGFELSYRIREFLARRRTIELDGTLIGWPWANGTFSWIEPTALALLALKTALPGRKPRRAAARIREAEKMIIDRECPGGGWNYGNKRVLGVDEVPYPDTTALALLALQDVPADAVKERGIRALTALTDATGSGLALSLAALCMRAYGLDAGSFLTRAGLRFDETGFMDETRVIALAALAARDDSPYTLAPR